METLKKLGFAASISLTLPSLLLSGFAPSALAFSKQDTSSLSGQASKLSLSSRPSVYVANANNEILVKYKNGSTGITKFSSVNAMQKQGEIAGSNISIFKITDGETIDQKIAELKNDPTVESAQPNYQYYLTDIATNDPNRGLLWGLNNTGQTVGGDYSPHAGTAGADIKAPGAWAIADAATSTPVIVAIIDSGVDYNHPDLAGSMWDGSSCKDENGVAISGGCNHGYDYEDGDATPLPTNSSHGTHIAGTIAAARNNGVGVIGVASNAKIMAIKTSLTTANIIQSIGFAEQNGAKIINASWGGFQIDGDADLQAAIAAFPGLFVTAAGNSAGNHATTPFYPCDYTSSNIVCVAATDQNDALASFSDYGAASVDVGAPGTNILSTEGSRLFDEDFEGVTPPSLGTKFTLSSGNTWGSTTLNDGTKAISGDYVGWNNKNYQNNISSSIDSSAVNLTGKTSSYLNFDLFCNTPATQDGIILSFWNGSAWNPVDSYSGTFGETFGYSLSTSTINNFKFRFTWLTQGSHPSGDLGCAIDNVKIVDGASSGSSYQYLDGTSMATPHVVGLAALIEGYNSTLTTDQVKNTILTTGDALPALAGKTVSGKRIDAANALASLVQVLHFPTSSAVIAATADPSEPPAQTITLGSASNTLAIYRFTETSNVEGAKVTDLTVFASSSALVNPIQNVTLWKGSALLATAGASVPVTGGYNYVFHLGTSLVVPQASSTSVTLKGDAASYASAPGIDNATLSFLINSTSSIKVIGTTTNASATVSSVAGAAGKNITVLRSLLTPLVSPLGGTSHTKSSSDALGTISLTANSAGPVAVRKLTLTFSGTALAAGSSTFLHSSGILLSPAPSASTTFVINPDYGTSSITWTFTGQGTAGGGLQISAGATQVFTLRVNDGLIPDASTTQALAVAIQNASDITYWDAVDTSSTAVNNISANFVPLAMNSVTFPAGSTSTPTSTPPSPTTSTLTIIPTISGSALFSDFNLTVIDGTSTIFSGALAVTQNFPITIGDAYSVSEATTTNSAGFTIALDAGCSGTMATSSVTCNINNTLAATSTPSSTITLNPPAGAFNDGQVGTPYTPAHFTAANSANASDTFTFSMTSGSLPDSFSLNTASDSLSAVLGGTPTVSGTSTFSITATSHADASASTTQSYSIYIAPAPLPPPTPTSTLNVAVNVIGGTKTAADFLVIIMAGHPSTSSFPGDASGTAVTIDANTAYHVNVSSTFPNYDRMKNSCDDNSGAVPGNSVNCLVTETFNGIFLPLTLPNGQVSSAYSQSVTASTTMKQPITWNIVSGALPDGLILDATATGTANTISGTPTVAGTFNFTVKVTSASSTASSTQAYTLTIDPAPVSSGSGSVSVSGGGGGGGGGGSYFPAPATTPTSTTPSTIGEVLGASTTDPAALLGLLNTLLVQLKFLEKQLITQQFKAASCSLTFSQNLSQGMNNSAVKTLQTALNFSSLTELAASGAGSPGNESTYFGPGTKKAVIAFQNIFSDEILAPAGLTAGNGYVGAATRVQLNQLCGH